MMEVIGSTELGAAALQPQRPWVVMSALGMVGGCRRAPECGRIYAENIRFFVFRGYLYFVVFRAIFTSKRAAISLRTFSSLL